MAQQGGVFTVCISNFIFLCCIFVSCQFSLLHHLDMVISRHIIVIINNVGSRQTELLLLSVLIEMKLCVKVTEHCKNIALMNCVLVARLTC